MAILRKWKVIEELLKAWDKTIRGTRYSVIVENVIDKASERCAKTFFARL